MFEKGMLLLPICHCGLSNVETIRLCNAKLCPNHNWTKNHLDQPVILHNSLRVGASPLYWLIMPLFAAVGTGIVRVIGLWNLRLRGSTVTIGETATLLPNSFDTTSGATGWAYKKMLLQSNLYLQEQYRCWYTTLLQWCFHSRLIDFPMLYFNFDELWFDFVVCMCVGK